MLTKERGRIISTEIWFHKYRILSQLGEGGTGKVFLAEHIRLGCLRAIKRISKSHPAYRQLIQEADILKSLNHPYIPVIYDVEEDESYSYIIMEYAEGLSLRALRLKQGNITEKQIVLICSQICEVFQLLHSAEQPVFYLDLKPDNIIVKEFKIKIIDFGSTKTLDSQKENISMGTRGFAAPEQYTRTGADSQSDIYGLGGLMLFMATGEKGTEGLSRLENDRGYTEAFKQLVFRCLKYNKTERFETISQVKDTLSALKPEGVKKGFAGSGTSTVIAFAGVQPRCGVTYICTLLTAYLCHKGERAVYVEAGKKRDIRMLLEEGRDMDYPVLSGEPERLREKYKEYDVFICDYGVYQEAAEGVWRQDILCLVTGSRPWELPFWEEAEQKVMEKGKNAYFLVNFTGGQEFFRLVKGRKVSCLRMPYRDKVPEKDRELSELLGRLLKRSIYERDIRCRRKAKEKKENSENSLFGRCRTWCRSYPYRHFAGRIFGGKTRGTDAVSGGKQA